jgi:hypothetical protein
MVLVMANGKRTPETTTTGSAGGPLFAVVVVLALHDRFCGSCGRRPAVVATMACPDHRDDNEILLLLLDSLLRATERNRGNIMVTKVSNQLQPESEQKWSLLVGVGGWCRVSNRRVGG